jgi:hypothetical protein
MELVAASHRKGRTARRQALLEAPALSSGGSPGEAGSEQVGKRAPVVFRLPSRSVAGCAGANRHPPHAFVSTQRGCTPPSSAHRSPACQQTISAKRWTAPLQKRLPPPGRLRPRVRIRAVRCCAATPRPPPPRPTPTRCSSSTRWMTPCCTPVGWPGLAALQPTPGNDRGSRPRAVDQGGVVPTIGATWMRVCMHAASVSPPPCHLLRSDDE